MRASILILLAAPAALASAGVTPDTDDFEADVLSEDVAAGQEELEALLAAEAAEIGPVLDAPTALHDLDLLGPAHPLRVRGLGAWDGAPTEELRPSEGDAGELLAELGGLDLATLKAQYDIPIELNDEVIAYIRFFQGRGRNWFAKWLARSERWIPFMRPILAEEGVPLDLVYLAMIESGFSPYAYSWARASGFWQFISATGKRYGLRDDFWVDERRDPVKSTRAAARYLKFLYNEFGDWHLAWAGYNAGEGKIRRAIRMYGTRDFWELTRAGNYLRKETKHYVPKLMAAAIVARHPERFGFTGIKGETAFEFDEVVIPDATDLGVIAKAAGVPMEEVQALNTHLRRWCTPPASRGKGYAIKIPRGTKETFLAAFEKVKPSERLTYRHYRVRKGDTLGHIARRYDMPVAAIMKLNRITNARHLRIGQDLIIPLPTQLAGAHPDRASSWSEKSTSKARRSQRVAKRTARDVERQVEAPAGSTRYVVRRGDTLWSIAQRFGVGVGELKKWNGIGRRGHKTLQVGQSLYVAPPSKKRASSGARGRG